MTEFPTAINFCPSCGSRLCSMETPQEHKKALPAGSTILKCQREGHTWHAQFVYTTYGGSSTLQMRAYSIDRADI